MLRVRVGFVGTQGSPYVSTFYFAETGSVAATAAVAAVGGLWDDLQAQMTDQLQWTTEAEVVELTEAGVVTASYTVNQESGTGEGTSEPLPIAAQGLLQWRTGVYLAGREVRGRTFLPGMTSGSNDDGLVLAANRALVNAAATDYLASGGCTPVVWSRARAAAVPITGGTCWDQFAMLTSRRD